MKKHDVIFMVGLIVLSAVSSFLFTFYGLTTIMSGGATQQSTVFAYVTVAYGLGNLAILSLAWSSREKWATTVNMLMGLVQKEAGISSFGFELGLQYGVDTESLIPSDSIQTKENADILRYLYRLNASYIFPLGSGLKINAGLINSFIGYESFLAIDNPNYTRAYLTDNIPYFFLGGELGYGLSESVFLSLFIVDGWNYLGMGDGNPDFGIQLKWDKNPRLNYTVNLYWGSELDKEQNDFEIYFFNMFVSWKGENSLFALSFDGGSKTYSIMRSENWIAAALWSQWNLDKWQLGIRPEIYYDPDRASTGIRQNIKALTLTLGYDLIKEQGKHLNARLEYRLDDTTSEEGGFYKGNDNHLHHRQNGIFLALLFAFGN